MNNVFFPAEVVLILRRLANVISTLSISNQYLLPRRGQVEEWEETAANAKQTLAVDKDCKSSSLSSLRDVDWPAWMKRKRWIWPESMTISSAQRSASSAAGLEAPNLLRASSIENDGAEPSKTPDGQNSSLPQSHSPRPSNRSNISPRPRKDKEGGDADIIHQLLQNPALYEPMRKPRYPIVLCHGLYGFDVRGPSSFPALRMQYWSNVLQILRKKVGAEVIVTAVPGTGSITSRSEGLDRVLQEKARGRGINLMAHSMGGLDCRHLISHVKPTEYTPLSLTAISTPHRGSPFMDWCAENIGLGRLQRQELENSKLKLKLGEASDSSSPKTSSESASTSSESSFSLSLSSLPSSFTTLLMGVLDSPAYSNLTTAYLNDIFNPSTPDDPRVKYYSVAGRIDSMSIWHPLWLPKMVLDGFEQKTRAKLVQDWEAQGRPKPPNALWEQEDQWGNDGLVTVQSARWGEFLGILEQCDHWEMRGARGIELDLPLSPLGIGNLVGSDKSEGWSLKDWGKFVGAWRKEEQTKKMEVEKQEEMRVGRVPDDASRESQSEEERKQEQEHHDAVMKSSTDKLSAVFDWVSDQVPAAPKLTSSSKSSSEIVDAKEEKHEQEKKAVKSELATKMDLERFYVALARKLYDDGF